MQDIEPSSVIHTTKKTLTRSKMSPFVRLVEDTGSTEANNTARQEPQAERLEPGPSNPGIRPLHNANTPEHVIIERNDPTRFQMVHEVFDHNTGELIDIPAERVEFGSLRPVLCSFDQYSRLPPSDEEAKQYLYHARIELIDKLPLSHPLWDRIKMNGSLKAEESPPVSGEPMQEDSSDEEAALKEALMDADCWDEDSDDAEDDLSEDDSDEDGSDEDWAAENVAVEDAAAERLNAESLSPRDVSSESSEEE